MASSTKRSWRLQEFAAHASNVNCLALGHKSGRVLVTGGDDKKVNLWAVGKPNCIMSLSGHTTAVECVQFGISEEMVCAGAASGALKLWDLEAAKLFRTLTGHKTGVRCIDFHPYGDFLTTGSQDSTVRLWDIRRKGCIYTYSAHKPRVNSVKFSPDGQWVASAGEEGGVKLWDLRGGRLLKEFTNHGGPVTSVAFHPNEFLLASSSADRTVNFWDLEGFQLISSTEPDIGGVRCAVFSEGGECLFAGSQDRLKVYGWEPTRTLDTVPISWGRIQDIAVAQNQLIGASFHTSMVVVNIVDLKRVQPFGGPPGPDSPPFAPNQSVRKSFSRPRARDQTKMAVAGTIEESDRSGTDPEDDALSQAEIQNMGDFRDIFQTSSRLCRTPPPEPFPAPLESLENDPSLPQILQPPSLDQSESSDDSQGAEPVLPVVRGLHSQSSNITFRPAPLSGEDLSSLSPTRDELSSPESWSGRRKSSSQVPTTTFPEVDFPVKLSSIRHSPSEPSLARPQSSAPPSRPHLPPAAVSVMRPAKRSREPQSVEILVLPPPDDKEDVFIPMAADKPSGLDLEEFMPRNYPRGVGAYAGMSEAELVASMVRGHEQMMAVLSGRQRSLQIVYSVWTNKDMKAAVDSALAMNDRAIIVDILEALSVKSSIWNLDICSTILPSLLDLLQSKYEMYMTVGCKTLRLILRNFATVIRTNIQGGRGHGVDITAEERYTRCKKCYDNLMPIRAFLLKRQTMQGKLGQSFRELSTLMENLD